VIEHITSDNPSRAIDSQLRQFLFSSEKETVFVVTYPFVQYYLPDSPEITLVSVVSLSKRQQDTANINITATVFQENQISKDTLASLSPTFDSVSQFCENKKLPFFSFGEPVLLQPIDIPKPWGKEVWYTG